MSAETAAGFRSFLRRSTLLGQLAHMRLARGAEGRGEKRKDSLLLTMLKHWLQICAVYSARRERGPRLSFDGRSGQKNCEQTYG